MNKLEKNMKRIGTKNLSEQQYSSVPGGDQQMLSPSPGERDIAAAILDAQKLLQELVNINRQMLAELQKMPK